MKTKHNLTSLTILTALCLTAFVISAAVTFTLNFRALYYRDIEALDIADESGYPEDEIKNNYDALIDYNSLFFKGKLVFPTLPMSESAEVHFAETKKIFAAFELTAFISLPLALFGAIGLLKRKNPLFLKISGIAGLALPAAIGAAFAVDWDACFVIFHKLFFNNDYWLFDWHTDPIILMLPDAYFLHCAVLILALIFVFCVSFLVIYRALKKRLFTVE